MIRRTVITFSGRLGSGKSTLANEIATILKWPSVSFGRYVRSVAEEQGIDNRRESLQALGAALIEKEGMTNFANSVLRSSGWHPGEPAVVEGIRHVALLPILRVLAAPTPLKHFHLKITEDAQRSRLEARETGEIERLGTIESHSTEADVAEKLEALADFILDADQPLETLVASVVATVEIG